MYKRVRELNNDVEELTRTLAETEFEAEETKLTVERTANDVQEKRDLIKHLEQELERAASGLGVTVEQAGGSKSRGSKSVADEQLDELNELMAKKKQLKATLRDSEKLERNARAHADEMEEKHNNLRNELADEEAKAYGGDDAMSATARAGDGAELIAEVGEWRKIIAEDSAKLFQLQNQIANLRKQMGEMNIELGTSQRKMLEAQEKNKSTGASAKDTVERKLQAMMELKRVESELLKIKKDPEAATKEALKGLPEKVSDVKAAILNEKTLRQKQQRRQAEELAQATESFNKELRKREHAERTLELLAEAKGAEADEVTQKNKELAAITREVMTLKLEVKQFKAKAGGVEELADLNKDVSSAQRTCMALRDSIKSLKVTISQLEQANKDLDEKLIKAVE